MPGGNVPYPPPYYNGHWEHGFTGGPYPPGGNRRDDGGGRRLSERISGFAAPFGESMIPAAAGLPPKPPAALDTALVSGNPATGRRNTRNAGSHGTGPPPPPPPDAKEDPRAAGGKRVSYHDMDLVAEVGFIYYSKLERILICF